MQQTAIGCIYSVDCMDYGLDSGNGHCGQNKQTPMLYCGTPIILNSCSVLCDLDDLELWREVPSGHTRYSSLLPTGMLATVFFTHLLHLHYILEVRSVETYYSHTAT